MRGGAAGRKKALRVCQKDAPQTPAVQGQGGRARANGFPVKAPCSKGRGLSSAVLAGDFPALYNFEFAVNSHAEPGVQAANWLY